MNLNSNNKFRLHYMRFLISMGFVILILTIRSSAKLIIRENFSQNQKIIFYGNYYKLIFGHSNVRTIQYSNNLIFEQSNIRTLYIHA
jgi:hypothetical protein